MLIALQVHRQINAHAAAMEDYARRIDLACEIAYQHGGADGAHHKAWVIDQMVRTLLGPDYEAFVRDATNDGEEEWDTGVAP